jgi:hypothetical protein
MYIGRRAGRRSWEYLQEARLSTQSYDPNGSVRVGEKFG